MSTDSINRVKNMIKSIEFAKEKGYELSPTKEEIKAIKDLLNENTHMRRALDWLSREVAQAEIDDSGELAYLKLDRPEKTKYIIEVGLNCNG